MTNTQRRKAYVSVNVNIDEHGDIMPCFVIWKNGLVYRIDKVIYKCRAASMVVSGGGIRYTVLIKGQESYLFQEGNRWFVEENVQAR